jgi:hypothetical protein
MGGYCRALAWRPIQGGMSALIRPWGSDVTFALFSDVLAEAQSPQGA